MNQRETPFALVFGAIAPARFPAVAAGIAAAGRSAADRDAFVLLEPVGRLLHELVPDDVSPDELEAHVRLLHHAYRHWAAGGRVYRVRDEALDRAVRSGALPPAVPGDALYLQLPSGRVWRPTTPAPEPLDGMFVTTTAEPGALAVLGIFGMHRNRPGFSAVAVDGRLDAADAADGEVEIAARREDGSAPFAPLLPGGADAGIYSVANAGELLLLTCRLLARIPAGDEGRGMRDGLESVMDV